MTEVRETILPGVGVRHEFTTVEGRDLGVVVHHDGRREIVAYGREDRDACASLVNLEPADSQALVEILGVSVVTEVVTEIRQQIGGLALDWIELDDSSAGTGTSIGDGAYRSRTGASIIAVIRNARPLPSPGPEFMFFAGDIAILVGAADDVTHLRSALSG